MNTSETRRKAKANRLDYLLKALNCFSKFLQIFSQVFVLLKLLRM